MSVAELFLNFVNKFGSNSIISFILNNKLVYTLVILFIFFLLSLIMKVLMHHIIPLFTKKTKTDIDDKIAEKTQTPGAYLVMLLGIYIALIPLGLPEKVLAITDNILLSICVLLFMLIGIRIIDVIIDAWGQKWAEKTHSTMDDALLPLLHKTSKIIFIIFGFIIILKVWKFNVSSILAGVGVAGIVLGLALKDSLSNIFGGISLVLDKSLKVGDKVKLGSGELGVIEDIGLRSTKLRTYDNELFTIPNGKLANSIIQNYVLPDDRHRVGVNFSVVYGSNVEKVKKVVLKALKGIENATYDSEPIVIFKGMADSGIEFTALVWSTWKKSYGVKVEARKRIYEALNKAKIGIPFPTRTIYMHQGKKKRK